MNLPDPLTPPELDLRDFSYMPLDVVRLRDSELAVVSSGEAFRAAVILWCASWHQVPAASLPNDDKLLASLAGFGKDVKGWRKLRDDAMRGFVKCSDGRWYHPVIAEKAIEAGTKRRNQRGQTAAATEARRLAKEKRDAERNDQRNDDRNDTSSEERDVHQGKGREGNRPESNRIEKKGESNSRPDLKLVEEDQRIPIDASYEPSDAAIEYAYSLGMKKQDLASELSKFIALSMASKATSYNPDMSFKAWCDRWLDFKRKGNPDWKPEPVVTAPPAEDRSNWPIIVEGTNEHTCWNIYNRENGHRWLFLCKQIDKDGKLYERAARCPTLYPPGFNDFGERLGDVGEAMSA